MQIKVIIFTWAILSVSSILAEIINSLQFHLNDVGFGVSKGIDAIYVIGKYILVKFTRD